MFKIDRNSNRISRLETTRFSELGFNERNHLQEWLSSDGNISEQLPKPLSGKLSIKTISTESGQTV